MNEVITNGKVTTEKCSTCEGEMQVRHGKSSDGKRAHYEECEICGSHIVRVAYECLHCDQMTFQEWMAHADQAISNQTGGLVSDDLADQPYRGFFDEGLMPVEAALAALAEEGFFDEEEDAPEYW